MCSLQQSAVAMNMPHLLRPLSGTYCVLPSVHNKELKHGYDNLFELSYDAAIQPSMNVSSNLGVESFIGVFGLFSCFI